jgi:5'-nucleotidase
VKRILVTNDDGIAAEGLLALEHALAAVGEVWTAAPAEERSASSHSITLRRPLRYREAGLRRWAVEGTPADAVIVGLHHLLGSWPDLVVSGINHGGNLGKNIHYSGTVSAAAEGVLNGIPGIAVSICSRGPYDFTPVARLTADLARRIFANQLPAGLLVNVNVPAPWSGGVRATRAYRHLALTRVEPREHLEGLWFQEQIDFDSVPADSDYAAVRAGAASVSLLEIYRSDGGDHAATLRWLVA